MKFIDEVVITVASGKGGPGCVSFRRESHVPRGGPDGGDGGRGGDVIFKVSQDLNTLLNYRYRRKYAAGNGLPGQGSQCSGKEGAPLVLEVPAGTVICDADSGELIKDLGAEGEYLFLQGGRGGKGNAFFKSSINQAPSHAQNGEPGEERAVKVELKLIADVGIIGFPNVGKSTLISHISEAKPKVANYEFTTLNPNLGVVAYGEDKSYVVADIPGLIKGASEGVGLGIQFLKHIERTRLFVHVIDISGLSGRDPIEDYKDINQELVNYDEKFSVAEPLADRKQIVVLNKSDVVGKTELSQIQKKFLDIGVESMVISAATGLKLKTLIYKIGDIIFKKASDEDC